MSLFSLVWLLVEIDLFEILPRPFRLARREEKIALEPVAGYRRDETFYEER